MESDKRVIDVGVFGSLSERERVLINGVALLSSARPYTYVFDFDLKSQSDIYLVDADAHGAVDVWKTAQSLLPAPSIAFVSHEREVPFGCQPLKRPVLPSHLLQTLDAVSFRNLEVQRTATAGSALVVDDSPTLRRQVGICLEELGFAVDYAETGEGALRYIAQKAHDIIFLDVMLPGIDGYQVCKVIKGDRSRKHIPVIMLTGKSSPFDRIRGSLAGCNSYLVKPVEVGLFSATVRKFLPDIKMPVRHMVPAPGVGSAS